MKHSTKPKLGDFSVLELLSDIRNFKKPHVISDKTIDIDNSLNRLRLWRSFEICLCRVFHKNKIFPNTACCCL